MNQHIHVTIREVYGARLIYPKCDKARLFAEIAGTRTLTRESVEQIKKLGFEVRVISESPVSL